MKKGLKKLNSEYEKMFKLPLITKPINEDVSGCNHEFPFPFGAPVAAGCHHPNFPNESWPIVFAHSSPIFYWLLLKTIFCGSGWFDGDQK